jgi:hypothetical protein
MAVDEAIKCKHGIFGLMERWGPESGDVIFVNSDPLS